MNRGRDCGQRRLRGWSYIERDSEQLATVRSVLPRLGCGTACQPTLSLHSRWQLSIGRLKTFLLEQSFDH